MYILAIETTGAYASVALLEAEDGAGTVEETGEGRILGVIHGNDRFSHLQNLTPQIDQILKENKLSIGDVTGIAVSHGPGSFTGIRIGVSTARALSQVLDIPCMAVSSLEALALRAVPAAAAEEADDPASTLLCPILDARRKQVYGAAYEWKDGDLVTRIPPASCMLTDFLQRLDRLAEEAGFGSDGEGPGRIFFLGDGIDTCGEILRAWEESQDGPASGRVLHAPEEIRYQDAGTVALRGLQLYRQGRTCGYLDLQPEYLRMAEAEKKLRDKQEREARS